MRLLQRNAKVDDALRRRLRAVDRRPQRRHQRRAPRRLVLLRQRHPGRRRAPPPRGCDDGDRVWWDRHDWTATQDVPAVVGSFPEPFVHGIERQAPADARGVHRAGRRPACTAVQKQLTAAGVLAPAGRPAALAAPRRRCACSSARAARCARDGAVRQLERGPKASAASTRARARDGRAITALDARGRPVRTPRRGHRAGRPPRPSRAGSPCGSSPAPTTPGVARGRLRAGRGQPQEPLRRRRLDGRARRPAAAGRRREPPARASPLHAARAGAGAAYCLALRGGRAASSEHPLVLGALGAGARGRGRGVRASAARVAPRPAARAAARRCSSSLVNPLVEPRAG